MIKIILSTIDENYIVYNNNRDNKFGELGDWSTVARIMGRLGGSQHLETPEQVVKREERGGSPLLFGARRWGPEACLSSANTDGPSDTSLSGECFHFRAETRILITHATHLLHIHLRIFDHFKRYLNVTLSNLYTLIFDYVTNAKWTLVILHV